MNIEETTTARGFDLLKFTDRYEVACILQKSSLATEDAIWFGCADANLKMLVNGHGWVPVEMPANHLVTTRMHLTRDQVAALLPYLQRFVETGEIMDTNAADATPTTTR